MDSFSYGVGRSEDSFFNEKTKNCNSNVVFEDGTSETSDSAGSCGENEFSEEVCDLPRPPKSRKRAHSPEKHGRREIRDSLKANRSSSSSLDFQKDVSYSSAGDENHVIYLEELYSHFFGVVNTSSDEAVTMGSMFPSLTLTPPPESWFKVISELDIADLKRQPFQRGISTGHVSAKYLVSVLLSLRSSEHFMYAQDMFFRKFRGFYERFLGNTTFIFEEFKSIEDEFVGTPYEGRGINWMEKKLIQIANLVMISKTHFERTNRFAQKLQIVSMDSEPVPLEVEKNSEEDISDRSEIVSPEYLKSKPHQKLLAWIINEAALQGLVRGESGFLRAKMLPGNIHSRFYEHYMTYDEFIFTTVGNSTLGADMFHNLTENAKNASVVSHFLQKITDHRIPFVKPDRTLFCTLNCLIDGLKGLVYPLGEPGFSDLDRTVVRPVSELEQHRYACNFFESSVDFSVLVQGFDCMDIPSPNVDRILDHQNFQKEDKKWFLGLKGRMVFPLNKSLDKWQMGEFIRGIAGSGKSTLLDIFLSMYPHQNTQRLAAESRSDFVDENILNDKNYIIYHPDIDNNCKYPPGKLCILIDGGKMAKNSKGSKIETVVNDACFVGAGNVWPPFPDKSGNIRRRLAIWNFANSVEKGDGTIAEKSIKNFANTMLKSILVYHQLAKKHGSKSQLLNYNDGTLPPMLHYNGNMFLKQQSAVSVFLDNPNYSKFGKEFCTTPLQLKEAILVYMEREGVRDKGLSDWQLDEVLHKSLFKIYGCTLESLDGSGKITGIRGLQCTVV